GGEGPRRLGCRRGIGRSGRTSRGRCRRRLVHDGRSVRGVGRFLLRTFLGGSCSTSSGDFLEPSGSSGGFSSFALLTLVALGGECRFGGIIRRLLGSGDFGRGGNVRRLAATTNRLGCRVDGRRRDGLGRRSGGGAPTTACWCRRRGLLLRTLALFALPTSAN